MDPRPEVARRRPAGPAHGDEVHPGRPRAADAPADRPQRPRGARPDQTARPPGHKPRRTRHPADPETPRGPRPRASGEFHIRDRTAQAASDPGDTATTSGRPTAKRPVKTAGAGPPSTSERRGPGNPAARPTKPRPAAASADAETRAGHSVADDTGPPTAPPTRGIGSGWRGGRVGARGLIAVLSVAVLLCTGYAWSSINTLESDITRLGGLALGGGDDGAVDILLVGTDSRTDAKGNPLSANELRWLRSGDDVSTNTDTILLIRVPNNGSSATAISIPRDSYVDVPGIGKSKINAAYGTTREGVRRRAVEAGKSPEQAVQEGTLAGRKALIDSVANLTGVRVDHYAEVGLLGFVLLTKAVGGVEVCLKNAVNEPFSGARFPAGRQTLSGPQALSFVRQRHELPRGDLDRITRQQAFMASLTQKILSAGTLTDPTKLSELQAAVSRSVVIDDDWNVVTFAEQLKDLSGGRVKFATIPVTDDHGWSDDGQQSVVSVDPAQVRAFTSALLDPSRNTGRGEYTVDVNNAGTVDGLAKNVSGILTAKGYQAGTLLSSPTNDRDSVVLANDADSPGAKLLAKDLGGLPVRADASLGDHQLRAVLTNTYGGAGSVSDVGAQSGGSRSGANQSGDNQSGANRASSNNATGGSNAAITAGSDGPPCVN